MGSEGMKRLYGRLLQAAPAFSQPTQQAKKFGRSVLCESGLLAPINPTLHCPPTTGLPGERGMVQMTSLGPRTQ